MARGNTFSESVPLGPRRRQWHPDSSPALILPSGLAGASGTLTPRLPLFSPQASRAPVAPLLLACLFLPSGLAGASDTLAAALFYIDYALTMVQVWVWMLVGVNPGPPL